MRSSDGRQPPHQSKLHPWATGCQCESGSQAVPVRQSSCRVIPNRPHRSTAPPPHFVDRGGCLFMQKEKTDAKKQRSRCFPAPVRLTFRRYSNSSIPSYHNQRPVATAFFCVVKYHTLTPPGLALVCCRASGTVCISSARTRSKLAASAAVYVMRIFKVIHSFRCSCHPLARVYHIRQRVR